MNMKIPEFLFDQDDNTVTITVYAPLCNVEDLDKHLDEAENTFLFSCKPYFLRVTLPGSIVEDDRYKDTYDEATYKFTFTYGKEHPGEFIPNLDSKPVILAPKVKLHSPEGPAQVEVVVQPEEDANQVPAISLEDQYAQYDEKDFRFGFGMMPKHSLGDIFFEFDHIFECDPREVSIRDRRKLRIQLEQGKFNVDHYLADFCDVAIMTALINQVSPYEHIDIETSFQFTENENTFLVDLEVTQQSLSYEQIMYGFHGIINLMFAYCYDKRINSFEECSESAWNINKLASSLCWFEGFRTPQTNIVSAFRRSLIYPLYRNFDLSCRVFEDLKALLVLPERHLTRALIDMYYMFLKSDMYILNKLFIQDYLIFVMKWDPDQWREVVEDYLELEITKEDLGLNLKQLEEGCYVYPMFATMSLEDEGETDSDDCSSLSDYSSCCESSTSDDSDEYSA